MTGTARDEASPGRELAGWFGYRARMRPAPPVPAVPTPEELARQVESLGRAHGLDAVGIAAASPLHPGAADPGRAEGRRPARRHGVHVPQPGPLDLAGPRRARRGGHRGRSPPLRLAPSCAGADGMRAGRGRVARYAWTDHYAPLREALQAVARHLRADGHRAVVVADDNAMVDREVAYRAGIGWFGKNANLLLPGAGLVVRARCRRHRRAPARGRRAGARRLRTVPALPRRLPDRRHRRSGRGRRAALPGVAGAAARDVPAPAPRGAARPDLRLRRLPGGVPAQPPLRSERPPAGTLDSQQRRRRGRGCRCSDLLAADDDELLARYGRWYLAGRDPRWLRRNALDRAGQHRRPRRRARRRRPASATSVTPTRCCDRTPRGPPGGWAATTCCGVLAGDDAPEVVDELARARPARAGCRREAPAGHERLPAQGRRDPELPVGALAPPAARELRRADQPVQRRRGVGPPAAVPRRAGCASRCCCRTRSWSTGSQALADGARGRARGARPRAAPGHDRPVAGPALRRRAARRGGHRARAPAGEPAAAGPRAAPRPSGDQRRRATRPPRRRAPPSAPSTSSSCPRASTSTASCPSTTGQRRVARSRFGLPADGPLVVGVSRLVPRKGFDTLIRAAAPPEGRPPRPHRGHRRQRTGRGPAAPAGRRSRAPGRVPGSGARRRPAQPLRRAPTSSPCCAAAGGAGWSRRASASSSSRPRPAASPRWRGRAAARPKRWSTARPGWWSTRRRTCRPWPTPSTRCWPTPSVPGPWARPPGAGSRRSSPTTRLAARLGDALDVHGTP